MLLTLIGGASYAVKAELGTSSGASTLHNAPSQNIQDTVGNAEDVQKLFPEVGQTAGQPATQPRKPWDKRWLSLIIPMLVLPWLFIVVVKKSNDQDDTLNN
jgi:hypothetical protein